MEERLQKLMAQAGIASRRDSEVYITAGRVTVNGVKATLGDKADPAKDDIRVDGAPIKISVERTYVMINKPMGIVTAVTRQSQEHRRVVRDMVNLPGHLYPVGRLDADSEGLVLLTDDGDMAQKLTHPRYEHPKTYEVDVRGYLPDEQIEKWRRGIVLDDGPTQPADVRLESRDREVTRLTVIMREGRKRQIRRIASLLGNPVSRLLRTHIGTLALGKLRPGEWRLLSESEIEILQKQAHSPAHRARRRPVISAKPARPSAKKTGGTRTTRKPAIPGSKSGEHRHGKDRSDTPEKKDDSARPRRPAGGGSGGKRGRR